MELSERALKYLEKQKENTPTPLKEKTTSAAIAAKKEELELKKLEIEIQKLEKPDIPENNYFKEMLEQQKLHFAQLLEMNKQHSSLQLEIEKLKMGGENSDNFAEDFMYSLMPLLPQLLAKKTDLTPQVTTPAAVTTAGEIKPTGENMKIPTAAEVEDYKRRIRAGEITEDAAYTECCEKIPFFKDRVTKEIFKAEFEKIKAGG